MDRACVECILALDIGSRCVPVPDGLIKAARQRPLPIATDPSGSDAIEMALKSGLDARRLRENDRQREEPVRHASHAHQLSQLLPDRCLESSKNFHAGAPWTQVNESSRPDIFLSKRRACCVFLRCPFRWVGRDAFDVSQQPVPSTSLTGTLGFAGACSRWSRPGERRPLGLLAPKPVGLSWLGKPLAPPLTAFPPRLPSRRKKSGRNSRPSPTLFHSHHGSHPPAAQP